MLLFYVRHGDPIYNPDSLTPLGERQAEAVGKRLALYGVDEIYVSSSNRAILTSKPTCEMVKKEATVLDWCHEGHAWADLSIEGKAGYRDWMCFLPEYTRAFVEPKMRELGEDWPSHPIFEGTSVRKGIERIKRETYAFLAGAGYEFDAEKLCYKCVAPSNKRIALFAHQGFGLAFLSTVLAIPYPEFSIHFDMSHTGVTVIEFNDNGGYSIPKIIQLSNDSHLYKEGLPTKYQNRIYF